ncbi:lymphatic vessel endothelial hyaluronic acid receptor 1 isoform 1-T1 [Discoglossus pictus]
MSRYYLRLRSKMTSHTFTYVLLSLLLRILIAHSSIEVKDLEKCRIAGVVLVEPKNPKALFNFTTAESVCQQLGLQLANKTHVEKANTRGFETCKFGWVAEQTTVISRIHHNENCGRNRTGVLIWSNFPEKTFYAYCFNASDTWNNSCIPEIRTTTDPGKTAQPSTTVQFLLNVTNSMTTTESQTVSTTLHGLQTTSRIRDSVTFLNKLMTKATLATTMTTLATMSETTDTPPNQATLKTDPVIFGGLPIALLTLALVFFVAAVALAICYIKKYKTNMLFRKRKEEKETVETKVFKDINTDDNITEAEQKTNGMESGDPQESTALTGNCKEAEV